MDTFFLKSFSPFQSIAAAVLTNGTKELYTHHEAITCRSVNSLASIVEQCAFVRDTDNCSYDGIFYSYTELTYCQLGHLRWLAILILLSILFMLFVAIGSVADDFLCPSLLTISKTFRLPDHIAGVTFLALGNGAPDIFSAMGGISQAKPQLIFSSLYGAGIFVSTVVAGSVLLTGEFNVMRRPILRDIIFYIGAAYLVWLFIFHGTLGLKQSSSFLFYYLLYIAIIIISRLVYVKWASQKVDADGNEEEGMAANEGGDIEGGGDGDRPIETISNTLTVPNGGGIINGGYQGSPAVSPYASPYGSPYASPYASPLPSAPGSRRVSTASMANKELKARTNTFSVNDDVVLTRFHRRGTLRTPRARSHSELKYRAHHHLENSINQIAKGYEERRRRDTTLDDVRYKKDIEREKAERQKQRHVELVTSAWQSQNGFTNDIQMGNGAQNVNGNSNNISSSVKPKYLSQLSTASIWSTATLTSVFSESKDFIIHISPVDILEWKNYPWYRKALELVKAIPYFIMTICIPVVDLESPKENWCRLLICANVIAAPQAILFLTSVDIVIADRFPLWAVFLIVSPIVSIIIFFTSEKDSPPIYNRVFGFIGFVISVIFVNTIAGEVIAVLTTFGAIFNLSDSILGLTVLAWGNSLGDLIADISMARHGYPGMAIAACFGGPMMNLLLGLGLPYTLFFLSSENRNKHTRVHVVEYTPMMSLLFATLMVSLCCSLVVFVFNRFKASKYHGFSLLLIYVGYLTLALLIEFKVLFHTIDDDED